MKQKLVSVIIPTFNRAHSVVEAIQSVKNQTYRKIQIIVIDDGSQDNTAEIVAQFKDIEYYYQENKGQAAARNLGLKYAKGEYLASLDSDDIWDEKFLTESIKCLEKHDLDFVFLNWKSTDGKETFLDGWEQNNRWQSFTSARDGKWSLIDAKQLRRLFLIACPAPTSSLLMRRSSVSSWNESVIVADDWFLILDMVLSKPCRAAFTLEPYWLKRIFGDNIYDGRNILEVTGNNLHDDKLMAQGLNSQLRYSERFTLRKRLACNHLNFGRLNWKRENLSKVVLYNVGKAFTLAPIGVSFYILEIFINHLKYRMKEIPPEKAKEMGEW
jgi:glycosyltransferase involved in cell wall biosynthesis